MHQIITGMAQFHKASSGISIPQQTKPSILLGGGLQEYQSKYKKLQNWKQERLEAAQKNDFDEQRKKWDCDVLNNIVEAYQSINPLRNEQFIVLTADALFLPHFFYGQISKYYEKREKEWTEEKYMSRLKDTIYTERSKERILEEFRDRQKNIT